MSQEWEAGVTLCHSSRGQNLVGFHGFLYRLHEKPKETSSTKTWRWKCNKSGDEEEHFFSGLAEWAGLEQFPLLGILTNVRRGVEENCGQTERKRWPWSEAVTRTVVFRIKKQFDFAKLKAQCARRPNKPRSSLYRKCTRISCVNWKMNPLWRHVFGRSIHINRLYIGDAARRRNMSIQTPRTQFKLDKIGSFDFVLLCYSLELEMRWIEFPALFWQASRLVAYPLPALKSSPSSPQISKRINNRKRKRKRTGAMTDDEKTIELKHDWTANVWEWPLQHNDGVVKVVNTADKFEVGLEAHFFTPHEIEIKVRADELIIHCCHEERSDEHGRVTREVHRAYHLPEDVDTTTIKSHLTNRGTLMITAQKKPAE